MFAIAEAYFGFAFFANSLPDVSMFSRLRSKYSVEAFQKTSHKVAKSGNYLETSKLKAYWRTDAKYDPSMDNANNYEIKCLNVYKIMTDKVDYRANFIKKSLIHRATKKATKTRSESMN